MPWVYVVKSEKYKGGHFTVGQKPQPFLEYAKLFNMDVKNFKSDMEKAGVIGVNEAKRISESTDYAERML